MISKLLKYKVKIVNLLLQSFFVIQLLLPLELRQRVVQDLELVRGEDQLQHLPDAHHDQELQ